MASGFNRLGPLRKNAGNQEVASSRTEVLAEMTNIIGGAFLGVTLGCARCHDHKFDPIRQSDYYRMQAFFAQTQAHDIVKATPEEQAEWKAKVSPIEQEMRRLRFQMVAPRTRRRSSWKINGSAGRENAAAAHADSTRWPTFRRKSPIHILARGDYRTKGQGGHAAARGAAAG